MSDDGLYIHEATEKWPSGTKVMRQIVRGEEQVWVEAEDFMAVQKERDDFRRTLAVINSARVVERLPKLVLDLLDQAGFGEKEAEAMAQIITQFRS
jgi:hypothetical protein